MTKQEVREYLENNDEGKELLEELKGPLVAKRDELLAEVKKLSERLTTETQRAEDSEKLRNEERAELSRTVVDGELNKLMDEHNVLPHARESVAALIRANAALDLTKADGGERVVMAEGPEGPQPLKDYFSSWTQSEQAKLFVAADGKTVGGPVRASGGGTPDTAENEFASRLQAAMG